MRTTLLLLLSILLGVSRVCCGKGGTDSGVCVSYELREACSTVRQGAVDPTHAMKPHEWGTRHDMVLRMWNRLVLVLLLLLVLVSRARAVCLSPAIRVDDEYFVSDLVVTASLIHDQKLGVEKDGSYAGHDFSWRVSHVYRGGMKPGETFVTHSDNDSGRFPDDAEDKHISRGPYLLFAFKHKAVFAVDNCGNSKPVSRAQQALREIAQVGKSPDGLMYGGLSPGPWGIDPSLVTITAISESGQYKTRLGVFGSFKLRVPPGTYRVVATARGHELKPDELSYKNPEHLTVPRGGSAGVAFVVADSSKTMP